ncbi:sentrin-specific protease 6-like isoform X2 [Sitodiplosis mosellana]|nr:sentrin-specific protease 6-like isoform X2 [Sitodiplosis mosellana]
MPSPANPEENVTLIIEKKHIVKLVCNFEEEAILVFHVQTECIENLRSLYEESTSPMQNWIVMETEPLDDVIKGKLKQFFSIYDEIPRDGVRLFAKIKMKPRAVKVEKKRNPLKKQLSKNNNNESNIDHIVSYPSSGAGAISITVPDFQCLAVDEFLNDVIINFYLQYIAREVLTPEQEAKTHIFNTFFYEALSARPTSDSTSNFRNRAHRRHERVEKWTKNVNLFEKDFVIVPINQSKHWFLAIICFPGLKEPETNGAARKSSTTKSTKRTKAKASSSDEEANDDENATTKRSCILIFDSMSSGVDRKVISVLREYLACEYKVKVTNGDDKTFDATAMPGHHVRVPRQTNCSDCGLFMLQYIEQFFKDPIEDFAIPIKNLDNWFDPEVVTNKRRDIVQLIKDQMTRSVGRCNMSIEDLPNIELP